jgi:hypothetical protein
MKLIKSPNDVFIKRPHYIICKVDGPYYIICGHY